MLCIHVLWSVLVFAVFIYSFSYLFIHYLHTYDYMKPCLFFLFSLTLLYSSSPLSPAGDIDYSKDFFGKRCSLTVSGQLNVETHACALSDVYTFGPTFRAENSHTSRHLAEFWMIEPEICFADLSDDAALAVSAYPCVVVACAARCCLLEHHLLPCISHLTPLPA